MLPAFAFMLCMRLVSVFVDLASMETFNAGFGLRPADIEASFSRPVSLFVVKMP